MAIETETVGDLVQLVCDVIGAGTAQTSYANQIKRFLHLAMREWWTKCKPSCLHKTATTPITTTAGTATYSLADDFGSMVDGAGVWCRASPFTTVKYCTMQDYVAAQMFDSARTSDPPTHWCLPHSDATSGLQIIQFGPFPSSSTRIIDYRYVAIPTAIDGVADATEIDKRIPPNLHHGFAYGAITMAPHLMEDQAKLALFESRWRSFLANTRAESNRNIGAIRRRQRYDGGGRLVGWPGDPTIDGTAVNPP